MSFKKLVAKLFWSGNHDNFVISTNESVSFNVNLGKLLVGTLEYGNNMWYFKYSEDF